MDGSQPGPQTYSYLGQNHDLLQWFSSCFPEIRQGFHKCLIYISFRNIGYNFFNVQITISDIREN